MANTYVKTSRSPHTVASAPYTVTKGQGMKVGSIFGIANTGIAASASGEIETEGVWQVSQIVGAQAWTAGQPIYWNDTNKQFDTTVVGGTRVGVAELARAGSDTIAFVRLQGFMA